MLRYVEGLGGGVVEILKTDSRQLVGHFSLRTYVCTQWRGEINGG